jgi:hypothetical protein
MLINLVMFNMHHPRRYLPRNNKIYLSPDGVTEIEGPGYKDPRKLWQTLIDPFDFKGLINGHGCQNERFWQREDSQATQQIKVSSKKPEAV